VRELREFRVHHDEFVSSGIAVAGVSRESVTANAKWTARLELPYPLLSDRDGAAGRALRAVRTLKVAGWTIELMRRATVLIDARGIVSATWTRVRVRGHAREVVDAARALG
jgi:thioredoxin-dependent peroxiredoxin